MFSLKSIAWKLFRAAKVHVLTSISIIMLSICLITTMAVYIVNANAQMEREIEAMYGEMDIMTGFNYGKNQFISDELYAQIQAIPHIDQLSPLSLKMTQIEDFSSIYTLGVENDALVKSRYHLEGDLTDSTIALSQQLANLLDVSLGERIQMEGQLLEVVEIVATPKGAEATNIAFVHNDVLKEKGTAGLFLLIQTEDVEGVAKQLKKLHKELRIDIIYEYDFVKINLQTLLFFVIVLSIFILLITGMLLLSTMQLIFTKLKQQFVILRSLGASSAQIGKLVNIQLLSINGLGIFGGLLLSIGCIKFGMPKMVTLLNLPPANTHIPFQLIMGLIFGFVLLLFMYSKWQMSKAKKLLPLQLQEGETLSTLQITKSKLFFISIISVIALLSILIGQQDDGSGKGALQVLAGALLFSCILLYLIPFGFQLLLQSMAQSVRKVMGKEAYLAIIQIMPSIRLNVKVVLSLVGLMVILVFGSSMLKTLQTNDLSYLDERYETELIVSNHAIDEAFTYEVLQEFATLSAIEGVEARSVGSSLGLGTDENEILTNFFVLNLERYGVTGDASNKIVITEHFAEQKNIQLGDTIAPYFYNIGTETMQNYGEFEVVKIIQGDYDYFNAYIDWQSPAAYENLPIYELMILTSQPVLAKEQVEQVLAYWPTLKLLDKSIAIQQSNEMFYQRWSLFIGVFIVLIAATCLGIIQTLLHMVYANRESYLIQRLLGLSPNGLVKLIIFQVLSFILYGLATGIFVGMLLTEMLLLIDKKAQTTFDYMTLGLTSAVFICLIVIIFGVQGYLLSRRKLSTEIVQS